MGEILWESSVNFYETILLFYLLYRKLGISDPRKPRLVISFFFYFALLGVLTFFYLSVNLKLAILWFLDVLIAYWAFSSQNRKKLYHLLLWPSCMICIIAIADQVTYSIALFLVQAPLEEMLSFGGVRVQFAVLYLLLCTLSVWGLTRIGDKKSYVNPQIVFLIFFLGLSSILATESILDIAVSLHTMPEMEREALILSVLCYVIFVMVLAMMLLFEYLDRTLGEKYALEEKQRRIQLERQQYDFMLTATDSLRAWKHDYQGQLRLFHSLLREGKYEELEGLIADVDMLTPESGLLISSGNTVVDATISLRMLEAKNAGIPLDVTVYLPPEIPAEDVLFSALIANVLDNALDACRKLEQRAGEIVFLLKPFKQMLYLSCTNPSDGIYKRDSSGRFLSTKKNPGHGIGISRIEDIVSQVGGSVQFAAEEDFFSVTVMIPLEGAGP